MQLDRHPAMIGGAIAPRDAVDTTEIRMDDAADRAEADARGELAAQPPIAPATIVEQARRVRDELLRHDPVMRQGVADELISSDQVAANLTTASHLQHYADVAGAHVAALGQLQAHALRLDLDLRRIQGQITGFDASGQGARRVQDEPTDLGRATALIEGASGGTVDATRRAFAASSGAANSAVAGHATAMTAARVTLVARARDVGTAFAAASVAEANARGAHGRLLTVLTRYRAPGIEAAIAGLRGVATDARAQIDLAVSALETFVRRDGASTRSALFDLEGYVAAHQYHALLARFDTQLRPLRVLRDVAEIVAARDAARDATRTWTTAGQGYVDQVIALRRAREVYDTHLRNVGASADQAVGGNAFSILAQTLAECDRYLAQAHVVLAIGEVARRRGTDTDRAADQLRPAQLDERRAVTWYCPYQTTHRGRVRWAAMPTTFMLPVDERAAASAALERTLGQLQASARGVRAFGDRLRGIFLGAGEHDRHPVMRVVEVEPAFVAPTEGFDATAEAPPDTRST